MSSVDLAHLDRLQMEADYDRREAMERFVEAAPVVPAQADDHILAFWQHKASLAFESYIATKRSRYSL